MPILNVVPIMFLCCIPPVQWANSQMSASFNSNDTSFCCNSKPGPYVQTAYTTLAEVVSGSPYYEVISTSGYYTEGIDNVCNTYYPCGDGAYVLFTTITYNDSSIIIEKFIISELTSYVGVTRVTGLAQPSGSSTIIYEEAFLGSPCSGMRVYYRKYVAGNCEILENATKDGTDFVHGDSSSHYISDYCANQVAAISSSQCLNVAPFGLLPNRLNSNCVTQWNGVSCVNACNVLPQDSYTLTDTTSSC